MDRQIEGLQTFIAIMDGLRGLMLEEMALGERIQKRQAELGLTTTEEAMQTPEGRLLLLQSNRVIQHVDYLYELAFRACDAAEEGLGIPEVVRELRASLNAARKA